MTGKLAYALAEQHQPKVPISIQVVIERINRKLAAKGQILTTTRHMRMNMHCGDYHILDLSGNVVDTHIDPEELARKLRVLNERETMKYRSRKARPKR
jgi:hypothetical protein